MQILLQYSREQTDLSRAVRSLSNDVAMVIEGTVQPYDGSDGAIKTKDMGTSKNCWRIQRARATE